MGDDVADVLKQFKEKNDMYDSTGSCPSPIPLSKRALISSPVNTPPSPRPSALMFSPNESVVGEGALRKMYRKFTTLFKSRAGPVRLIPDRNPPTNPTNIMCEKIETDLANVISERANESMYTYKMGIVYFKMRTKREESLSDTPSYSPSTSESPLNFMEAFENVFSPNTPSESPSPIRGGNLENRTSLTSLKKVKEVYTEKLLEVTKSQHILSYKLNNSIKAQLPHNPPTDYEKCYSIGEDFTITAVGQSTISVKGGRNVQAYLITITFVAYYTLTFAVTDEDDYQDWLSVLNIHATRNIAVAPMRKYVSLQEEIDTKIIEEYNMLVELGEESVNTVGGVRFLDLMNTYSDTIRKIKNKT
ncbi:elongation factor Ts [Acrasis kona]|uniref:Elongation factor Ts n=1 Tax=Acrasis kona TaxID=1008807 RepID=A0AAW2YWD4_9EUKA